MEHAQNRRSPLFAGALLLCALPAAAQRVVLPGAGLGSAAPTVALPTVRAVPTLSSLPSAQQAVRALPSAAASAKVPVPVVAAAPLPAAQQPSTREGMLAAARRFTRELVARHLARRKDGVRETKILASNDTKTITEYSGVPGRIERLATAGKVYRHWIKDEETLGKILASGALRAGETSYVEFTGSRHAFIKDIYPELHGAFFTTPAHSAGESRVMNWEVPYYVDFTVPEGVEALRLDGDEVLMFPAETGAMIPIDIVGHS